MHTASSCRSVIFVTAVTVEEQTERTNGDACARAVGRSVRTYVSTYRRTHIRPWCKHTVRNLSAYRCTVREYRPCRRLSTHRARRRPTRRTARTHSTQVQYGTEAVSVGIKKDRSVIASLVHLIHYFGFCQTFTETYDLHASPSFRS